MLSGWEAWAYPGTSLQHTDHAAHAGTGAGVITVLPEGAGTFPLFCQRFDVQPGQRTERESGRAPKTWYPVGGRS